MNITQEQLSTDWYSQIDEVTNIFTQINDSLSLELLNQRPNPGAWSIAQIMDHLITLNETYYPLFKSLREGTYKTPFIGRFGFIVNFFGEQILKSVQPDATRKAKTLPLWEPTQSAEVLDIFETLVTHQNTLKSQIKQTEYLIAENIVIASPANQNIVYRLSTAFDIITTHERRHAVQAQRIQRAIQTS